MENITQKIDAIIADNDARVAHCVNTDNFDGIYKERLITTDNVLALFQELLNEIKNA
jgi:hypothetical protein